MSTTACTSRAAPPRRLGPADLAVCRLWAGQSESDFVTVTVLSDASRVTHHSDASCHTDIRLAMTAAMRRTMKKNSHEFDPRKFLQAAMDETEKVCIERFEAFGSAGQAAELEVMAQRYKAGTLRQVVH
jgi:hypothetical protein